MPLFINIQKLWDQKYRDESAPFEVDGTPDALNLANGSVTPAKLAPGSDGQVITTSGSSVIWSAPTGGGGDPSGPAGGDLSGTYPNPTVANGAVTSAKIADGTIVDADINATAAIAKTKISGTAITAADTGTVTSAMILDGTIVNGDVASGAAVSVSKLAAGTNGQVLTTSGGVPTWASTGSTASAGALGWYDTRDYGAKADRTRADNADTTASNATISGTTFSGTATDSGKLIRIQAAGTTLFSGTTNGNMTFGAAATNNRFTCSAVSFDQTVVGRWLTIMNGTTVTLRARVLGVESATQLRLATPCSGNITNLSWFVSEDHYTTIASSIAATSAALTVAPATTAKNCIIWYGTDDASAIQAAVTDAESTAHSGGSGNVVYHVGQSMIGTPIYMQKPTQFIGAGSRGYSQTLSHGRTILMLGAPRMRGLVAGGSDSGMGVNGSMTNGSAVLTDPGANFQVGDVGKNIIVYGAGTQTGSSTGFFLNTTISSRTSATSVTLAANAASTVAGAIYSYSSTAGYNGGLVGPSVKNLHVEGGPGQLAGLHLMNVSEVVVEEVCCSEFGSGVAHFMDPGPSVGFTNNTEFRSCYAIDSRVGFKSDRGTMIFTGQCFVDGNSNRVDCNIPEGMTLGVDGNSITSSATFKIQAVGTCVRSSGRGGDGDVAGVFDSENMGVIFDLQSDGANGGQHHRIGFNTTGNSNAGGGFGIRLRAGARAVLERRGFSLDSDVNMYGLVDAAAHLAVVGETISKAGPIGDADFFNQPYDGAIGIDTANNRFQVRVGGGWRYTATTGLPSRIKLHDSKANTVSSTTRTLSVTSTIPVGHFLIVPIVHGSTTQTITVTDTQSNTWNTDAVADLATGQTPHAAVASAKVTTQLTVGDTITVTVASAVNLLTAELYEYAGLATSSWLDKTSGATGTGTAVDSGATASTTVATELLVGVVNNAGSSSVATQTPAAGWTVVSDFTFGSGLKRYTFVEQIVTATGTYNATETLSASNDWAAVIATYKAA